MPSELQRYWSELESTLPVPRFLRRVVPIEFRSLHSRVLDDDMAYQKDLCLKLIRGDFIVVKHAFEGAALAQLKNKIF